MLPPQAGDGGPETQRLYLPNACGLKTERGLQVRMSLGIIIEVVSKPHFPA
jgi:hypothetical protein